MTHEPHRPTSRVLDILETLAQRDGGLTLTELSRSVDAPASSLTPFLRTLCARGYLDCKPQEHGLHAGRGGLCCSPPPLPPPTSIP